jgi:hypothetical protein
MYINQMENEFLQSLLLHVCSSHLQVSAAANKRFQNIHKHVWVSERVVVRVCERALKFQFGLKTLAKSKKSSTKLNFFEFWTTKVKAFRA